MKIKKYLLLALSATLLYLSSSSSYALNVERISGTDRYETTLKSVQKYYNNANGSLAVLASGSDFKTALYGSYLANAFKVPFYITPSSGLKSSVYNDLVRTGVKRVYLMGSENKTNRSIENYLISKGMKVTRFYNNKLGDTNHYISNTFFKYALRGDVSLDLVMNTNSFPDLLSSIPFISTLAREQNLYINNIGNVGGEGYRYIIGGFNSVPSSYRTYDGDSRIGLNFHNDAIYITNAPLDENFFDDDYAEQNTITIPSYYSGRIAGDDRYKTAIEIAKAYMKEINSDLDTVVLVDGTNYPDALSSGVVAVNNNAVVLLTKPNKLNSDTKNFLIENGIKKVIIVGGQKSVSNSVESELREIK